MNLGLTRDILSQDVEQLVSGSEQSATHLVVHPTVATDLEALFEFVRRIRLHLQTPEPSQLFREALRLKLVTAANERTTRPRLSRQVPVRVGHRREFIFGVAALGSIVSVAAAFVVASRARAHAHSRPAA